ncbi:MAG: histidine kinase [Acidovorax sp.]|nr:histidine kinase [Acidovorax sp.]
MNSVITTSYNPGLIALSYVISVVGAFAALSAASRVHAFPGRPLAHNWVNLGIAGIALGGIGVWSMHFIGMLALNMDMGLGYSMVETVISLVAAIVVTALALAVVAKNPRSINRVLGAGAMLGLGAGFMHYLGMYGMRFGGHFRWSFDVVGLSLLIALVAATAALWLAFHTRTLASRLLAACVMGLAVCAMHYTGMAAAEFICTTENRRAIPSGFAVISVMQLPLLVITLAVGMATTIAIDLLYQSTTVRKPARIA